MTTQGIESISLGFPTRTIVPVSFSAQTLGELTLAAASPEQLAQVKGVSEA
jgi:hypothetical protein